jgi:hypothetical protein
VQSTENPQKSMTYYHVTDSYQSRCNCRNNRRNNHRNNRRAVILQMTQVACQELYFGHVRSSLDSFQIVLSLMFGPSKNAI